MGAIIVVRIAPKGILKNDANRKPEIALVATSCRHGNEDVISGWTNVPALNTGGVLYRSFLLFICISFFTSSSVTYVPRICKRERRLYSLSRASSCRWKCFHNVCVCVSYLITSCISPFDYTTPYWRFIVLWRHVFFLFLFISFYVVEFTRKHWPPPTHTISYSTRLRRNIINQSSYTAPTHTIKTQNSKKLLVRHIFFFNPQSYFSDTTALLNFIIIFYYSYLLTRSY